jgi:hypothetical protein
MMEESLTNAPAFPLVGAELAQPAGYHDIGYMKKLPGNNSSQQV